MEFNSANDQTRILSRIATNDGHGENTAYFEGWKAYEDNPFDYSQNPRGVIQMGLAENRVRQQNILSFSKKKFVGKIFCRWPPQAKLMGSSYFFFFQLCFDLIQEWVVNNPKGSICTPQGAEDFKDIAIFQDYHGLPEFRNVRETSSFVLLQFIIFSFWVDSYGYKYDEWSAGGGKIHGKSEGRESNIRPGPDRHERRRDRRRRNSSVLFGWSWRRIFGPYTILSSVRLLFIKLKFILILNYCIFVVLFRLLMPIRSTSNLRLYVKSYQKVACFNWRKILQINK